MAFAQLHAKNLFLFIALHFFVGCRPLNAMQKYKLPTYEQLTSEVKDCIATTPTGCTFLLGCCKSGLSKFALCACKKLRHPIAIIQDLFYRPACLPIKHGIRGRRKVVHHRTKTSKTVAKTAKNACPTALTITLHSVNSVAGLLKFFDGIKFEDSPTVNTVGNILLQGVGFIRVMPDKCPLLYGMIVETARRLECDDFDRVYIYKGNFCSDVLEKMGVDVLKDIGLDDYSCTASDCFPTRGTGFIFIGKDLFLGVNADQASYMPGLKPEEIQAILGHEIGHYKSHHTLRKYIFNAAIGGILAWFILHTFSKSSVNNEKDICYVNESVDLYYDEESALIFGSTVFLSIAFYRMVKNLFAQYVSRHYERQADMCALKAIDNPEAMAEALVKLNGLATLKRRPLLELLRDHPDTGTRQNYLRAEAARILAAPKNGNCSISVGRPIRRGHYKQQNIDQFVRGEVSSEASLVP